LPSARRPEQEGAQGAARAERKAGQLLKEMAEKKLLVEWLRSKGYLASDGAKPTERAK
jgi:hypothetical protein